MIAKGYRITVKEFNQPFTSGNRIYTSTAILIYKPDTTFRTSVVVGKNVLKSKPLKNKIRRKIYSILREYYQKHPITGTYIFLIQKPAISTSHAKLTKVIEDLITRAL